MPVTTGRPAGRPQGPWEELRPQRQREIMREYEKQFACPQCGGEMRFVEGVTRVFHTWACRFRRFPIHKVES